MIDITDAYEARKITDLKLAEILIKERAKLLVALASCVSAHKSMRSGPQFIAAEHAENILNDLGYTWPKHGGDFKSSDNSNGDNHG